MTNSLKNILLIDDEEDIREIAKISLEKIGNFSVKCCASGKEALDLVKEFTPDLIILDMMMPEMDGVATLKALRAIPSVSKIPFVFMTAKSLDTDKDHYLSQGVVDIVKKPFNPRELPEIINKIWNRCGGEIADNEFENKFTSLTESYSKNLPNKIQEIKDIFTKLSSKWSPSEYIKLTILIHKLSGSAGIYGFMQISEKALKIEQILSNYDYDIPIDNKTMYEIDNLISEIEKILVNSKASEMKAHSLSTINPNLIYFLIDNDPLNNMWQNELIEQIPVYGYETVVFNDVKALFIAIEQRMPISLLINFDFLSNCNINDPDLYDFINIYFKKIYTIFISKSGEFTNRLNAARMGCKSYLVTPFNIDELIEQLDNLKDLHESHFKAVIIDDDPEVLSYYSNVLIKANIENRAFSEVEEIEEVLHDYQPDIILLDLNMPVCSGIEVAAIIRQNKLFEDVPIIFLSTEENKIVQLTAMSVGADDFITKSADPNQLIQTIKNKAKRYKNIKSLLSKNNLTGAFNFRYMTREIKIAIDRFTKKNTEFVICMTEINNLPHIKNLHGSFAGDQVLVSLYLFLIKQLDSSCIIGHYSHEKFIILFKNTTSDEARKQIHNAQEKFRSILQYAAGKAYAATFNAGFAIYQAGDSIEKLIKKASMDLAHDINKKSVNI